MVAPSVPGSGLIGLTGGTLSDGGVSCTITVLVEALPEALSLPTLAMEPCEHASWKLSLWSSLLERYQM
jgi:hypothetical protein